MNITFNFYYKILKIKRVMRCLRKCEKKSSPTAATIPVDWVTEMEKKDIKLEGIFYTVN